MTEDEIAANIGLDGVKVGVPLGGGDRVITYARRHPDGREYAYAITCPREPTPQDIDELRAQFTRWWANVTATE